VRDVSNDNTINRRAHTTVEDCYQCGKCTAGCPVAERMDLMPNQVVRLAQVGDHDQAVQSRAIWLCVSCQTCSERCPKGVDVAGVMDAFRQLSAERDDVHPAARRTVVFQRAFLDSVRRHGRVYELELIAQFKGQAFLRDVSLPLLVKDATLAPRLIPRRKMPLRPDRARDRGVVQRIFARCAQEN
jgi:heterodisulfide reductase subunit C